MEEKSTVSVMESAESAESVESVHGTCGESAACKQEQIEYEQRGIGHAARWLER